MKQEQAQELYSEYAEGTLTPALRLALEQHFESDPAARDDYAQFAGVFSLLEQPDTQEMEAPLGFRAKILERAAAEQAKRDSTFTQRAAATLSGWFSAVPHRRATGGALGALAAVALIAVLFLRPATPPPLGPPGTFNSTFGFGSQPAANVDPAVIQKVDTQTETDNNNYHLFHLHLPPSVPAATVDAYVVTATEQITDPAHLSDATPALKQQHLTNHQGVQIPIAPLQAPPAGSTLDLLVQWTPDDPQKIAGSEVVFTPFGTANAATLAPANANFLDAMQAVAAHYGSTVIVDTDSVPTQTVSTDFAASDAKAPLEAMAKTVGYSVQPLPNNTFYVYETP